VLSQIQKTDLIVFLLKIKEAYPVIILKACTALNIVVGAVIRFAGQPATFWKKS
jgi:hypothetical protein